MEFQVNFRINSGSADLQAALGSGAEVAFSNCMEGFES
jgi:hypothetical protein